MPDTAKPKVKILHLLTAGEIGGIEVLLRNMAEISACNHSFAFLSGKGTVYEQLLEQKYQVSGPEDENRLSLKKLQRLREAARDRDILVIHNDDPFLQFYFLCLRLLLPNKKTVAMIHHCYTPEIDYPQYGRLKKAVRTFLLARTVQKADRLIFVSKAGLVSYREVFAPDEKSAILSITASGEKC